MSPVNPATNTPERTQEWRGELRLGTTLQRFAGRWHLDGGSPHRWGIAGGRESYMGVVVASPGAGLGVVDHVCDYDRRHGGQPVLQRTCWVRTMQVVLVPAHRDVLHRHHYLRCCDTTRQEHRDVFNGVGMCWSCGVCVSLCVGVVPTT